MAKDGGIRAEFDLACLKPQVGSTNARVLDVNQEFVGCELVESHLLKLERFASTMHNVSKCFDILGFHLFHGCC